MIMKVCMHKVLLNRCRATYPKQCYMIIDRSYMTEKMLIVMLSTNALTKRIENKAITKKKNNKNIYISFFLFGRVRTCVMTVLCSFLCSSLTLKTPQLFEPNNLKVYNTSKNKETKC